MSNLLIEATAGSGKTTTVVNAYTYMRSKYRDKIRGNDEQKAVYEWCANNLPVTEKPKVAYFTFSKSNQESLEKRIYKGCRAWTFHGYGSSVLNRKTGFNKLNSNRSIDLVSDLTGVRFNDLPNKSKWWSAILYLRKLKLEFRYPTPENFMYVQAKYPDLGEIPYTDEIVDMAKRLMAKMATPNRCVEFVDMAWLGCLHIDRPEYDIGFVDECQDLSVLYLEIVKRACKHIVFCGDPNQAIMQFAGAHASMFGELRGIVKEQLPLKETFRCPPNIARLANQIRPTARMRSAKTENGIEIQIPESELLHHLKDKYYGHSIICRTNAPLFGMAFKMLKAGIPAYMVGSDVIETLASLVRATRASSIKEFLTKLDMYTERLVEKSPNTAIYMEDRADCLRLVAAECQSVDQLIPTINRMFDSPQNAAVCLSSIHRAKGLEWPNVYVLNPPIPHPRGLEDQVQAEQEHNLSFVGVTRTSHTLVWVPKE